MVGNSGKVAGVGVAGKVSEGRLTGNIAKETITNNWHKSTFGSVEESMSYHLLKHGKGRTLKQYTEDATNFYNKNKQLGKKVILKDGTEAIKIQTGTGKNKIGGYWTKDGKIVTFWD
ncbi:tRNA(Glu)-specific nuclease WapA [Campylobacter majalis]|uniref:tRNA(Glu)-specific nuclease WapA n=1 Tax=Campylobacter majalis TaxID=2790656 RepID=A0ABN7K9P2_9BACT|nr:tRNA(Glu)-specific nuclease WapA [Campylobacter majalis]